MATIRFALGDSSILIRRSSGVARLARGAVAAVLAGALASLAGCSAQAEDGDE